MDTLTSESHKRKHDEMSPEIPQPAQLCPEDKWEDTDDMPSQAPSAKSLRASKPLYQAVGYEVFRPLLQQPRLDFEHQEMDRKSGLIRVPLLYGGEQLTFRSTRAGFMTLPFGLSEPFGSKGGGPMRRGQKTSTGLYSAFLEIPETVHGTEFLEFLDSMQEAILQEVCNNKVQLGMPLANRVYLEQNMHPLVKGNANSVFSDSVTGVRVKVNIGGRSAMRCTKKGVPLRQGAVALLKNNSVVDPTWTVKGIWSFQGKWGIVIHMVQAEVVDTSSSDEE